MGIMVIMVLMGIMGIIVFLVYLDHCPRRLCLPHCLIIIGKYLSLSHKPDYHCSGLRILSGKKHPQIKLQRFRKV